MNFFRTIKSSIYDPVFYREILNKPLGYSFKYFFSLVLILTLLSTLFLSVVFTPKIKSFFDSVGQKVITHYPENLEVIIKDGIISTNAEEPYFVKIPENLKDSKETEDDMANYENFLVIDTSKDFSLSDFNNYKTFALLTKDAVVYKDNKGKITIQLLEGVSNVTINRTLISSWVDKLTPFVNVLPFAFPILVFVFVFVVYLAKLVYFLLAAVLVYLVLKLQKMEVSYKKSYQITIHAATLPILLHLILFVFDFSVLFLPTALLLLVVVVNFKKSETSIVSSV